MFPPPWYMSRRFFLGWCAVWSVWSVTWFLLFSGWLRWAFVPCLATNLFLGLRRYLFEPFE